MAEDVCGSRYLNRYRVVMVAKREKIFTGEIAAQVKNQCCNQPGHRVGIFAIKNDDPASGEAAARRQ
jgi:hypothetical protein